MKNNSDSIFSEYKKQIHNAIEDLKTKGRRYRQIPNLLTLIRLMAPCFIIPVAIVGNVPLILGLTAFFSLTDFADGLIARKFNLTSELGELLDAVTDKVFASTLLIAASFSNPILLCNLTLEGAIAGINIYKKLNNQPVKSSFVGKTKTWFLFSLTGIGIISSGLNMVNTLNALMVTTTAMQVCTIASYLSTISVNKQLEKTETVESVPLIIPSTNDFEQKKFQKEKILESDISSLKVQTEECESLRQLRAVREFLVFEKMISEVLDNSQTESNCYVKSKKDDLKS